MPTYRSHPLENGIPPRWASEWGDDIYGPFVVFKVNGVSQWLRWIPAGRFLMGSPENEPGRLEWEGPQHEVTISEGYFLAESPCTQALWEAVMDENPSRFPSPERPVECVSWDDCQRFLERLNELVPGLDAHLPTEAQWEYACRAGTTVATYAGPIEILGQNNAPVLDSIAWYGGNSGRGFEFLEGEDSSSWPEKQYEHRLAGTHPVGLKHLNRWGLYDMLGNVFEWCSDHWSDAYAAEVVVDPSGPTEGQARGIRGGAWGYGARYVRAAVRDHFEPENRADVLGLRLARGHVW